MKILLAETESPKTPGFSPFRWTFKSDSTGFSRLALLARQLQGHHMETIELSLEHVSWFDANLSAPLGAVLYRASRGPNAVTITDVEPGVASILQRNGFLGHYGRALLPDPLATTIPYQRLEPGDDRFFGEYISTHLQGKDIPEMSDGLRKKFLESLFEIFSNAVIHSGTKLGIYVCGQFFPQSHRLDFSVADLGIGIPKKVRRHTGERHSADEAIGWAVSGSNTTKTGSVPGGLGLKLLREFTRMNGGRIQIVSDRGYWEQRADKVTASVMDCAYPGTVVNLELNTADTKSYCLASELDPDDLF